MNSKKVIMTLSVLATPFAVEAALETNTAQAANTYTINQNVKTYANAANAAKSANSKSTYGQGTYHIYKQANGMINISKTPGKAGAWINPAENKAVVTKAATNINQTTNQVAQSTQKPTANQYALNTSVKTYTNASSAASQTNARSTYAKGNYYVYKTANGMMNISRTQGKAGAWINPAENKVAATPTKVAQPTAKSQQTQTTKPAATTTQAAQQYTLTTDVNTYTNAGLAASKTNAKSKYTKGNYFVYKTANGMINISKTAGKAGAWINPTENKVVQAKIAADAKKETVSAPKQQTQTTKPAEMKTEPKKATQEPKPATTTTTASTVKAAPKFDANGLLVRQRSAKGQQVINHLMAIPGHRNGAAYHASSGVDKLIDELTTEEALWVIHRIEGAGFGQTGDGYAGIDTAKSHQVFVQNQLNRRFGGSVHALLKKWGTYSYGGY
ncbi:MAG: hypothetical protein Q3988_05700 [Gemella sp.]|nr:hypothetical protein [Gemella sp.]